MLSLKIKSKRFAKEIKRALKLSQKDNHIRFKVTP